MPRFSTEGLLNTPLHQDGFADAVATDATDAADVAATEAIVVNNVKAAATDDISSRYDQINHNQAVRALQDHCLRLEYYKPYFTLLRISWR